MAAKKKIAPPKPVPGRPWSQLSKAEQNLAYVRALSAYAHGGGENPTTKGAFDRSQQAAEAKA
jgi:hypothetical protein